MTERYDHRTAEDRAADAEEDAVIERPVQAGAADLRREVEQAAEQGDVEDDPSGQRAPDDPS